MTERSGSVLRVPGVQGDSGEGTGRRVSRPGLTSSFRETLEKSLETRSLKFSKHAAERLGSSERPIGAREIEELERACARAEAKGARTTLVLMPGMAFVVAPQSRTVVTVIPEERLKENVFTEIDSAVIVSE